MSFTSWATSPQPLHCAERNADAGGNGVHIFYTGPHHSAEIRTNFHAAWDSEIILDAHYDWGDYVAHLEHEWLPGKDETAIAQGDLVSWANECHAQAIKAYALLPADFTLTNFQFKSEVPIVDEQLAKAGVRLAAVLNAALAAGN